MLVQFLMEEASFDQATRRLIGSLCLNELSLTMKDHPEWNVQLLHHISVKKFTTMLTKINRKKNMLVYVFKKSFTLPTTLFVCFCRVL